MTVTDLNWKDALKVVRVGRAVANPNSGFQKQLQEFESNKLEEVCFSYFIKFIYFNLISFCNKKYFAGKTQIKRKISQFSSCQTR